MKQTLKEVQIPKIKNISNEEDKVFGKVKYSYILQPQNNGNYFVDTWQTSDEVKNAVEKINQRTENIIATAPRTRIDKIKYIHDYLKSFKVSYYLLFVVFLLCLALYIFMEIRSKNSTDNLRVSFVNKVYGDEAYNEEFKDLKKDLIASFWQTEFCLVILLVASIYAFSYLSN